MMNTVYNILSIKAKSFKRKPGFDHWIALLVVAGLALLIGTVLRAPLNKLATELVANMQGLINTFFNNSAAGTP